MESIMVIMAAWKSSKMKFQDKNRCMFAFKHKNFKTKMKKNH